MAANFAYNGNIRDFKFILQEWLPTEKVFAYPKYAGYSKEDIGSILEPYWKICKEKGEEANVNAEAYPCHFDSGKVTCPPGYGDLFRLLQGDGWGTSNITDDEGNLPEILLWALQEMLTAACPSFSPYIELTNGAATLIYKFGSDFHKEKFLPKMMDGSWAGTMCLTEPTAGSDVGDIVSKAYPTDEPGVYKIKGPKIFITGGDNDFCENHIHLFLARVEGAKAGTGGISLFIVPKFWVNDDGSLEPNDVELAGIEHKMGLRGSVTASLAFGDNNACRGYLLGVDPLQNEGKGQGMAQMFVMMNGARMATSIFALGCLANAFGNALEYCKERIQGRPFTNPRGERQPLVNHEDIRRTLLLGKASVEAFRAMIAKSYFNLDVRHLDPDPDVRKKANDLVEIATPLCKAHVSDEAWILISEAIQAYGGYGYCEEYPAAQCARDCKIYSIWEGTNYIQAQDLIGRKWSMGKGQPFRDFIAEIKAFVDANKATAGFERQMAIMDKALADYDELFNTMAGFAAEGKTTLLPMYARRVLTATSQLYAGYCILDQAVLADQKAKEVGPEHFDYNFYVGKVAAATYYVKNVVPNIAAITAVIKEADTSCLDIPLDAFIF